MMKLRTLAGSSVAILALSFSAASNAALLTMADNVHNFSWSYATGSYNLTGTGSLTVAGFNSSSLTVAVTLNNTAPNSGQGGDRLTAFAFGIDPNASSVAFSGNTTTGLTGAGWAQGALPSNVQGVEVCAWGGQNCSGGSNGGIFAGYSDSFSILLGSAMGWGSQVNIDPIGIRYQTGNGSFTFAAGNGTSVPEPGSLALLGLGLMGLAAARRRRKTV